MKLPFVTCTTTLWLITRRSLSVVGFFRSAATSAMANMVSVAALLTGLLILLWLEKKNFSDAGN